MLRGLRVLRVEFCVLHVASHLLRVVMTEVG